MSESFEEIFESALEQKGLGIKKLADLSHVPERYLEMIRKGDFNSLPSAPYLHGYIIRIGEILDLEGEALWQLFKREHRVMTSGREDHLPRNRFALPAGNNTKAYTLISVAVIVIIYIGFRYNTLFGKPQLTILDPAIEETVIDRSSFTIFGTTDSDNKISINGELIDVKEDGTFKKDVLLESGINTFEIKASKFLGRETALRRQIVFSGDTPTDTNIDVPIQNNASTTEETDQNTEIPPEDTPSE